MKLNYNCVRDILFLCESSLTLNEDLSWEYLTLNDFKSLFDKPKGKYSKQEVAYTLILLDEAGYIVCEYDNSDNCLSELYVSRLTYDGHEFIDTIRSDSIWKKITSCITAVGSASLPVIQNLGSQFLLEALSFLQSSQLGH